MGMTEERRQIVSGQTALTLTLEDGCARIIGFGPHPGSDAARPHGLFDNGEWPGLIPMPGEGWTGRSGLDVLAGNTDGVSWHLADEGVGPAACHLEGRIGDKTVHTLIRGEGHGVFSLGHKMTLGSQGWMSCGAVPLPGHLNDLIGFGGRWAGELQASRQKLETGTYVERCRAGNRLSHDGLPFLILGEIGFGENHGVCLGVHLAAQGDYDLEVSRTRIGELLVQGFAPASSSGVMPTLYLARSTAGLNGLRRAFQAVAREKANLQLPRKVQLNTWEGVYFEQDEAALKGMADVAAELGAEHFVLDDGWFGRRRDDRGGLGDWAPREKIYPNGLGPLIGHVNQTGMSFGLWLEPEMVSRDSALYEAHPDWIHGPSDQPLGRGQFGLDLTLDECNAHLRSVLKDILSDPRVSSLKWDCNRDLPGCGPDLADAAHDLMTFAKDERGGDLAIESCASGGGRLSWAFLETCDRYWLSDAHDPDLKLEMLRWASVFFPPEILGTHIGPEISHLTGRRFSLRARAMAAMMGHMGLELDPRDLSVEERKLLAEMIAAWKARRDWMAGGRFEILPEDEIGRLGLIHVSKAHDRALVCVLQTKERRTGGTSPLRVPGLAEGGYQIQSLFTDPWLKHAAKAQPDWLERGLEISAEALAGSGLHMPILPDGRALLIDIVPADENRAAEISPAENVSE